MDAAPNPCAPLALPAPDPAAVRETAARLKALADETRLRMVALLAQGPLCVCHVAAALELSQPNASQHLARLRHAGLALRERRGAWTHYRLRLGEDPAFDRLLAAALAAVAPAASDQARLEQALRTVHCP